MHFGNVLEPWILLRLAGGVVAVLVFARASPTAWRVLRHFDLARYSEGQLALERQADLSAALVRVGTVLQVALLALTMLAGDRLSASIRGAMCGYGVFNATAWGFRSLGATAASAIAAGIVSELYAFDARVRSFDLARPLALATILLVPLSAIDLGLASAFALNLDLPAVASCCSVQLDAGAGAGGPHDFGAATRTVATAGAALTVTVAVTLAFIASRHARGRTRDDARRVPAILAAAAALVAFPFAIAASVLEVAPHVFEVPQHVCPFCLLRASALGIGYPLFSAILIAVTSALGTGISALLSRTDAARAAFGPFARERLRREAFAWIAASIVAALPIARYAIVSGGASLFR